MFRKFAFLAAASVALTSAAPAHAATGTAFDKIVVFGDSLSDVGNIYTATSAYGVPTPATPYYDGRYSNGQLWVEHIAGVYGIALKPALKAGTDWAYAGAETTVDVVVSPGAGLTFTIPSLQTQAKEYLAQVHNKADAKALYVIWGGGNDVENTKSPSTLPALFAQDTVKIVTLLKSAGAKNFLIPSVPNVGVTPRAIAAKAGPAATKLSAALNTALDKALASSSLTSGIHLYRINPFQAIDEIIGSKTHFNLTNVTAECIAGAGAPVCTDVDHHLFWDDFHPTAFVHADLAIQAEAVLPLD